MVVRWRKQARARRVCVVRHLPVSAYSRAAAAVVASAAAAPAPDVLPAAAAAADAQEVDESPGKRLIEPAAAATRTLAAAGGKKKEKKEVPVEVVIPGKFRLKKPANWIVLVTLAIEFVQMAWFPLQVCAGHVI